MPVALLPPITSSFPSLPGHYDLMTPLNEALRYVRGRDANRWHRIRSAVHHGDRDSTTYNLWCGPFVSTHSARKPHLEHCDRITDGLPECGSCFGKSFAVGQDKAPIGLPPLRFDPRWLKPPKLCPGSQSDMFVEINHSVGQCLACGELERIRVYGGSPWYGADGHGPQKHEPGVRLVDPCPFHAWNHLRLNDNWRVVCRCGWHERTAVVSA